MRSGRLRHRLILQNKVETRDAYGAATITWATQTTVWGAIEPLSGTEYQSQAQIEAEAKVRIVMRYYSGINETWRVVNDNRAYSILSVINHDDRNRMLTLMCLQGVKDAASGLANNVVNSGINVVNSAVQVVNT